jgi:hypothetical protein
MSNYIRSVSELSAEIAALPPKNLIPPTADAAAKTARPIAIVGVHGISPIQQFAFQDQLATGLLAYLNAHDRRTSADRRSPTSGADPADESRSGTDRRTPQDRRSGAERRTGKPRVPWYRRIFGARAAPEHRAVQRRIQRWTATPYWPRVSKRTEDPVLKPSALRLHLKAEAKPSEPTTQVYDVYEGYWSPFSKGKTNIASLGRWLLRCLFLANSATAQVPATREKLRWDLGYVFGALAVALLFFVVAVGTGLLAWTRFAALFPQSENAVPKSFWAIAANPFELSKALPWYAWVHLVITIVIAYLVVQLVVLARTRWTAQRRKTELLNDSSKDGSFRKDTVAAATFQRATARIFIVVVGVLVVADIAILTFYGADLGAVLLYGALLLLTVGCVQAGRWILDFVVENILGDVQIYTTHDCNSKFYAVRQQIMSAVTNAMLAPLNAVDVTLDDDGNPIPTLGPGGKQLPDPPLYSRVHVAGHSLGSTIALDVILRIRQHAYEGAIDEDSWGRVRSLTTFGSALEKTRFLLDVRNPTVSAAQQQWQNDAYGRFFTDDVGRLDDPDNSFGIYWSNHWYPRDVVANKIVSYKSVVKPGSMSFDRKIGAQEHPICHDDKIVHERRFWEFVHGDYLGDPVFWRSVGPILTRT